jgi:predicted RNA-binding protein with PUA-like domain
MELMRVYWMHRSEPTIMTKDALEKYLREARHETYIREYEAIGVAQQPKPSFSVEVL